MDVRNLTQEERQEARGLATQACRAPPWPSGRRPLSEQARVSTRRLQWNCDIAGVAAGDRWSDFTSTATSAAASSTHAAHANGGVIVNPDSEEPPRLRDDLQIFADNMSDAERHVFYCFVDRLHEYGLEIIAMSDRPMPLTPDEPKEANDGL